jgi:2-polyprenyl-3-methyl-5-hydroxy-6-metoxy-1,4-benzoquinol methylase
MYGKKDEDPVVRYYDYSLAKGESEEMPYYLNKVEKSGGPILDMACGTGRLSLEFARAGYRVTSIDNSEGMLGMFEEKLQGESDDVKKRIKIIKAPFNNFKLSEKYKTIICCDAFFHNLSVEDEKYCLRCVREHMEDDAIFVFNIPNPNPKYLL